MGRTRSKSSKFVFPFRKMVQVYYLRVRQQMNKPSWSATTISYFFSSTFIIGTKTLQGSNKLENLKKANVFWGINDQSKVTLE